MQKEANKIQIKKAVEDLYGVTVESVKNHDIRWHGEEPNHKIRNTVWQDLFLQKAVVTIAKRRND
ncbi:MAG: 50S ribosomal protein L23 [Bacteroidales bacterium]